MTITQLIAILAEHDMQVDSWRGGAGKFRDLHIGTGRSIADLQKAKAALDAFDISVGSPNPEIAHLARVTNEGHPDYGKPYLEIYSFWWEDPDGLEPLEVETPAE